MGYSWKLLLICFSSLYLNLGLFAQSAPRNYWYIPVGTQDTLEAAYIDYRSLPKEKVLYVHQTDGNVDTINNAIDTIAMFYADHSYFYPFSEPNYFFKQISAGAIPLFEHSFDVVNAPRWKDQFHIKNYLFTTPGSSRNFFTDRREYLYFILNGDTFSLNKTNYRNLLWPEISKTFELNKRSIQKAKQWEWVSIIDYHNGNFSTITNRKGENEIVFGLDADFRDGFLTHLSYYDYKGQQIELNSREECLRIESFTYQNQYFELIIDNKLLQELDALPRHTWKRMDGAIELYYYENFITYRDTKEAFETTELEEIEIVKITENQSLHLLTEKFYTNKFKDFLLALPEFKAHFKGSFEPEEFNTAAAVGLYNYWHKKSPTR